MKIKGTGFLARWTAVLLSVALLLPSCAFAMDGAVYEIFVASFYDSDGDGVGDLRGVREKLDYVHELGAENLWLMPISPSPSYHKYDVTDYLTIAPEYGTMDDFDALAAACEERGMGLVIDLVINHSSNLHPWFVSATQSLNIEPCGQEICATLPECREHNQYCRYYHFTKDGTGHTIPAADDWTYEGAFGYHMPDFNLDEPLVRQEIKSIMTYWLTHGATGFRLDAVLHYYGENVTQNTAFMVWLNDTGKAIDPDCFFVAEAWKDGGTILKLYESGIDSFFNFPMSDATGTIISQLRKSEGYAIAAKAAQWQADVRAVNPAAIDAPFLSNHDMGRSAGVLVQLQPRMKLAASIYLLMGGTPYIYYGEELGMTGSGIDENKRLPMLWSATDPVGICNPPADADQAQKLTVGADEQADDEASLLSHYRNVLAVRNACPVIASGTMTAIDTGNKTVMALRFEDENSCVEVYHNLSKKIAAEFSVSSEATYIASFEGHSDTKTILDEHTLTLPIESSVILKTR